MARYRYRTPAVAGRWRDSREDAARDAVVAKQASFDDSLPGGLRWIVPGTIEEEQKEERVRPRLGLDWPAVRRLPKA